MTPFIVSEWLNGRSVISKLKIVRLSIRFTAVKICYFFWRDSPQRVMASAFLRFLDHTQRRTTVGRTPLDEWSARLHRTLPNNTQHSQQTSIYPEGFEPTISAGEQSQTYALLLLLIIIPLLILLLLLPLLLLVLILLFVFGATAPLQWARASSFMRFPDHTRHTTVGRSPLDEWSARRTDLYVTTRNTHNRHTSMPALGIEP
jgi:hypothetical protein